MKMFVLSLLFTCGFLTNYAQENQNPRLNMYALKVAFITKDLNLTTEEAEKFWPVYNTYINELKKARSESGDDIIGFEEKMVAIKKKYVSEFKRILVSDERTNRVFLADRNFGNAVKKELQNRQRLRNGGMRPQMQTP
jgi:hypothetical protein